MTNPDSEQDATVDRSLGPRNNSRVVAKIGVVLMVLSCLLWFTLFAIPYLSLSIGQKAALVGAVIVVVQVVWWTGAALAGPDTVAWIKSRFRRGKKPDADG